NRTATTLNDIVAQSDLDTSFVSPMRYRPIAQPAAPGLVRAAAVLAGQQGIPGAPGPAGAAVKKPAADVSAPPAAAPPRARFLFVITQAPLLFAHNLQLARCRELIEPRRLRNRF
ncbi:MAG: hypothetical protein ACTS5Y_08105, partial [Pollutimonas bauzanensis]